MSVLRHRGIEAWLEDTNGLPISFGASGDADISSNTISTWVNVTPRQFYTLRWRTCAGSNPRSALCKVYLKDGFHSVGSESSKFCVSISLMDEKRKVSQSRTTKEWLNPPYSRFGCLRVRRRLTDDSTKKLKTRSVESGILVLGSSRLEIRRVSGDICKNQVYWGKEPDGCVFDPKGIKVIDDAAQGEPPYIVFEFKFREDPKITQRIIEENHDMENKHSVRKHLEISRKSSRRSSAQSSDSDWDSDDDDSDYECWILKTKVKKVSNQDGCASGADITTQRKRSYDANNSNETINSAKLHTSTSDSVPNKLNTSRSRPSQQDKVSSYPTSSPLVLPATGRAEGIPDITSSIGPSTTHTSFLPLIPRGEIVSNVKLVAPDTSSGLKQVVVAASQSKVAHPPSPLPSTTKDISHTEMILSTELAKSTSEPSPASPADRTTTTNLGMQIRCSDVDMDALAFGWESKSDTDAAAAAAAFLSHSHNSPVPTTRETDSSIQTICEPETGPRINEVQQSSESGNLTPPTGSEIVNANNEITLDISMASNLDLDGREKLESNPAIVVLEKSSDIMELSISTSRKGKRKMFDRGDDTNSRVPEGDEGFKRRITMVEEDDSDIEFIGSWIPDKIRTKNIIQTAVKMEDLPVKLESLVSDSDILLTAENPKIKLEDNQLDCKMPIDEMMGNYDALERKKKELEEKLAKKIAATQMEIEELSRRLSD